MRNVTAQTSTNPPPLITTNYITAAPHFRRVDGQLYNTALSVRWEHETFIYIARTNNLVVARQVKLKPTYTQIYHREVPASGPVTSGNFIGGSAGRPARIQKLQTGMERVEGARVAITNLNRNDLEFEQEFSVTTMVAGVARAFGKTVALHDVGTPNIVPVIRTNEPVRAGRL